jgi:hypothetical protein
VNLGLFGPERTKMEPGIGGGKIDFGRAENQNLERTEMVVDRAQMNNIPEW